MTTEIRTQGSIRKQTLSGWIRECHKQFKQAPVSRNRSAKKGGLFCRSKSIRFLPFFKQFRRLVAGHFCNGSSTARQRAGFTYFRARKLRTEPESLSVSVVYSLVCYVCATGELGEFGECREQFQYDCTPYASKFPGERTYCRTTREKHSNGNGENGLF